VGQTHHASDQNQKRMGSRSASFTPRSRDNLLRHYQAADVAGKQFPDSRLKAKFIWWE